MSIVRYVEAKKGEDVSSLAKKTATLLKKSSFPGLITKNDFVGIKTHFGEKGNTGHIKPLIIKRVADLLQQRSKRVFLIETNTLYAGQRANSVEHIKLAYSHEFDYSRTGIPIIIADGLKGRDSKQIAIDGRRLKSVKLASDIVDCDFLLVLSHMTGHMQAGFGAAIKNLGMGCASRTGKLEQHSNVLPQVTRDKCTGCGTCIKWCPVNAISIEGGKAVISADKCIGCGECTVACKTGAIGIKWSESVRNLQEKMAEYALGVKKTVSPEHMYFVNFLTQITKDCDCMAKDEPAICEDIGIMASSDPVALDKASVDMVIKTNNKDIFKLGYPEIDWSAQLEHAESVGLGDMRYEIERL